MGEKSTLSNSFFSATKKKKKKLKNASKSSNGFIFFCLFILKINLFI